MKDEYVVYGKHDATCQMRYADGKPMEGLICVCNTEAEALKRSEYIASNGWYNIRIAAHVGDGSPKDLAGMFIRSVKV